MRRIVPDHEKVCPKTGEVYKTEIYYPINGGSVPLYKNVRCKSCGKDIGRIFPDGNRLHH